MPPSFKHKYNRRGKKKVTEKLESLRRSPRTNNKNPILQSKPTPDSTSSPKKSLPESQNPSSSSSDPDSPQPESPKNPLDSFAKMALKSDISEGIDPSPTPASMQNLSPPSPAVNAPMEIPEKKTEIEVIDLEESGESSTPMSSPATVANNPPPIVAGTQTEVQDFGLNKLPMDSSEGVGKFASILGTKLYYTTVIDGQRVHVFKPPHAYIQNPSPVPPISKALNFEIGSGSRNVGPAVVATANMHGSTFGSNTRGMSPPIDAVPLQSRPPATGTLFDLLGLNEMLTRPTDNPRLTPRQQSLVTNLAKSAPGNPHLNFTVPFSPPPLGGVKRPSGVVFKEPPSVKKPFKEETINHVEFQAWKLAQERLRSEAVERTEKRVYVQLWGAVLSLQKQCMDYNRKIRTLEQQVAESGLIDLENRDKIDNLEMLLGLAIKSLKMDAKEIMELKKEKATACEVESARDDGNNCVMNEINFNEFTPDELDVLPGKERLLHLNRMLQVVGGGVGCSRLAIVTKGCCNRLMVSGSDVQLDEENEKGKEKKETDGGSSSGKKKEEKKAVCDAMQTTTNKPAFYPTPRE